MTTTTEEENTDVAATEGAAASEAPKTGDKKEEEKIEYKVVSDDMRDGWVRAISVQIPYDVYGDEEKKSFASLKKNVSLPGFRKGKAPEALIRRRFGEEIEHETVQKIAERVYEQARADLPIDAIALADMEDYALEKEEGHILVDYTVEVRPVIEAKGYDNVEVEVPWADPEQPERDKYLDNMAERWGSFAPKDGDTVAAGDAPKVTATVTDAEGNSRDQNGLENTNAHPMDAYFPAAVVEKIVGAKVGDQLEVKADPKDISAEHPRVPVPAADEETGEWTYNVTIDSLEVFENANIDDAFVKENFKIDTVDEYWDKTLVRWNEQKDNEKRQATVQEIYKKLLEANEFHAPASLVERQARMLAAGEARKWAQYGIDPAKVYPGGTDGMIEAMRGQADTMVRMGLIADAIGKQENIEADEKDIEEEIARRAEQAGRKPLAIRAQLERSGELDGLEEDLKMKKVDDYLVEKAKVTFVDPPSPEELEAAEAAEAAAAQNEDGDDNAQDGDA